ncbi:MAG TPA: SGNH/GDSL hydrolase family protein [Phycisphaerae bacterium]|nr:SGNH/GDSL hydrolase family protein [Phycisphaerae bacterium]
MPAVLMAQDTPGKAAQATHWVGTWATSAQAIDKSTFPPTPPGLTDTTLRQIVHVSIGGHQLRVRFSNEFASWGNNLTIDEAHVALSAGKSAIKPETDKALTFHGQPSATIPFGAMMLSDPIAFDLPALSDLVVSIHVTGAEKDFTGHRSARANSYLQSGNSVSASDLPDAVIANRWYYLSGVEVVASPPTSAVAVLGDSITDGKGSTEGTNQRWPDVLARRLQENPGTAGVSVLNEGIGGNCLWFGGLGQTAMVRLDRDVIAQPGVRYVILFEGINDLGGGQTTPDEIITADEQIIARSHGSGLRIYGATISPCGGSFYDKPGVEEKRQKVNEWIRTSGAFDAVIDLDAAVRDPQDPHKLLKSADSGDHLHPSNAGHKLLGDAVDLKLFAQQ